MFFQIQHTTEYVYPEPATESFSELRVRPRDSAWQTVSHYFTRSTPAVMIEQYTDYFGNCVETLSIPFRHTRLTVTSTCDVVTKPFQDPLSELRLSVSEATLWYRSSRREVYDFLIPSRYVVFAPEIRTLAGERFPPAEDFATSIRCLNDYVFEHCEYVPGRTDVNTDARTFLETKEGVCQDFAHLMIAVCRSAGIPARYVSGYIETGPALENGERLVGSTASHAWLEVLVPPGVWVGLDPTNHSLAGERHVQIGVGRDYFDVPPLKGVFKGPNRQSMSVTVRVTRDETPASETSHS